MRKPGGMKFNQAKCKDCGAMLIAVGVGVLSACFFPPHLTIIILSGMLVASGAMLVVRGSCGIV